MKYIQEILGHKNSKTTGIYTHMSTQSKDRIKSPLDTINPKEDGGKWKKLSEKGILAFQLELI